jgi:ubiquinone/menaquinone biosynthesis C-methylase UbiE
MQRTLTHELMDDPNVPRRELGRALRYIRAVNRNLGGVRALLNHLKDWSVRWPKDRPVTMLDVATGSADLPLAAWRWARGAGFDLRVTAIDKHSETLEFAREQVRGVEAIRIVPADALAMDAEFGAGEFDYVHAGLFLHHLPEEQVVQVLRSMDRAASKGIVWNDLVRSPVSYRVVRLLTIGQPRIVKHDARVSVLAGFTQAEAEGLAQRAAISYAAYSWRVLTHRFTLAGEKPGAWGGGP